MEIELRDVTESPEQVFERLADRRQLLDDVFREMAILDTVNTDGTMLLMLEAKILQVKARRPELSDTDAYIVAGRLLKQLIACYQSGLNQLLP